MFFVFFLIVNLPFLTITHVFGIETFIDSFKYPNSYQFIKIDKISFLDANAGFILLEKANHQGYNIQENDIILYYTTHDTIQQKIINKTVSENGVNKYYTLTSYTTDSNTIVYEYQIIGKIKGNFDDTIWNTLCIYMWHFSIEKLNTISFFYSNESE
ncbi:hypothetical protein AYK25_07360 [Thermoplasmatales archaeon SM1-50]|nr:MAG: hypothetical protein AYK25_07360 [Thermoplasmatales archaeon SM1-50]